MVVAVAIVFLLFRVGIRRKDARLKNGVELLGLKDGTILMASCRSNLQAYCPRRKIVIDTERFDYNMEGYTYRPGFIDSRTSKTREFICSKGQEKFHSEYALSFLYQIVLRFQYVTFVF